MKRAVIVQGLGFGDEGKGATVDFLTRELSADLVVRYCGGSQAGHNVVLPDGRRHVFSQFGAGTLAGAATYLSAPVIINPPAMRKEAEHLRGMTGNDPFEKLSVHPQALVSTIYHQQLNRLRELSRGANRHGSCGHGIGETRNYWLKYGCDAVFAADLRDPCALDGKMELLRQRALLEVQEFLDRIPAEESWRLTLLAEPAMRAARELREIAAPLSLQAAMPSCSTAIFEGAQGVLLDEWSGFHPHTTWSTVTLEPALAMIEENGAEELCVLGVTRAYATRHGAGPLPTTSPKLDALLTDPGNPTNDWQGTIRRGWLDLVLLKYAAESAGGDLHGLVVNGLDELAGILPRVCMGYRHRDGRAIKRLPRSFLPFLAFQEGLTALLREIEPVYASLTLDELQNLLAEEIAEVSLIATGPTWSDRSLQILQFERITRQMPTSNFGCQ